MRRKIFQLRKKIDLFKQTHSVERIVVVVVIMATWIPGPWTRSKGGLSPYSVAFSSGKTTLKVGFLLINWYRYLTKDKEHRV